MPTPAIILNNAPIACYLAANKIEKSTIRGGGFLDPLLAQKIYLVYKILNKIYTLNPNYDGIVGVANYLWELCGEFGVAALGISGGGGGSVAPVTPGGGGNVFNFEYLIEVRGGVPDFASATDYDDSRLFGHNLVVFWNDIPKFLTGGTEWAYTPTGIRILIDGFDATVNDYYVLVFIKDPLGTSGTTDNEVTRSFQYTGVTGFETSIFSLLLVGATIVEVSRGTDYELIYSGTPTGLQALVGTIPLSNNLCDGNITFASDNPIIGPPDPEIVTIVFSKSI